TGRFIVWLPGSRLRQAQFLQPVEWTIASSFDQVSAKRLYCWVFVTSSPRRANTSVNAAASSFLSGRRWYMALRIVLAFRPASMKTVFYFTTSLSAMISSMVSMNPRGRSYLAATYNIYDEHSTYVLNL